MSLAGPRPDAGCARSALVSATRPLSCRDRREGMERRDRRGICRDRGEAARRARLQGGNSRRRRQPRLAAARAIRRDHRLRRPRGRAATPDQATRAGRPHGPPGRHPGKAADDPYRKVFRRRGHGPSCDAGDFQRARNGGVAGRLAREPGGPGLRDDGSADIWRTMRSAGIAPTEAENPVRNRSISPALSHVRLRTCSKHRDRIRLRAETRSGRCSAVLQV